MTDAPVNLPKLLRETAKAIRPLIEESLQLRDDFAAYRTSITEAGGDWMALKALVKAQVEDEREGKGEHTRVAKIIAKADASASYADILNLNENNSFPHQHGVSGPQPHAVTYPNAGGGSDEPPATHPETITGGAGKSHPHVDVPVTSLTLAATAPNTVAALSDEHGYMREDIPAGLRRSA